jgi:hypothetical protein
VTGDLSGGIALPPFKRPAGTGVRDLCRRARPCSSSDGASHPTISPFPFRGDRLCEDAPGVAEATPQAGFERSGDLRFFVISEFDDEVAAVAGIAEVGGDLAIVNVAIGEFFEPDAIAGVAEVEAGEAGGGFAEEGHDVLAAAKDPVGIEADFDGSGVGMGEDVTPFAGIIGHFGGVLVDHEAGVFAAEFGGEAVEGGGLGGQLFVGLGGALGEGVWVEAHGFEDTGGFADTAGEVEGGGNGLFSAGVGVHFASVVDDGDFELVLAEEAGGSFGKLGGEEGGADEFEGGVTGIAEGAEDLVEVVLHLLFLAGEVLAPDVSLAGEDGLVAALGGEGGRGGEGGEQAAAGGEEWEWAHGVLMANGITGSNRVGAGSVP